MAHRVTSTIQGHEHTADFEDIYEAVSQAQTWRDECKQDGWVKLQKIPRGIVMGKLLDGEEIEGSIMISENK